MNFLQPVKLLIRPVRRTNNLNWIVLVALHPINLILRLEEMLGMKINIINPPMYLI